MIDDKLNWSNHISHIKSKISSSLYAIKTAKSHLSKDILRILYFSLVHPHLDYGILLWGLTFPSYLKPLANLQNKIVKTITYDTSKVDVIYKNAKILKLEEMQYLQLGSFMFKYMSNSLPEPLLSMFITNDEVHNHNTRQKNNPHTMIRRTAAAQKTILHKGPNLWNKIPKHLKESKSLKSFKYKYKKLLINSYLN